MANSIIDKASFWQKNNDIKRRGFSDRLLRFLRARISRFCATGWALAQEPRIFRAWRCGWEREHYRRLLHWRDEGFRPKVVYDIGAHTGCWTEMCQATFAPSRCLLFEPQVEYLQRARRRKPQQGDWSFLAVALGDEEVQETLHLTWNRAASSLLAPIPEGDMTVDLRSEGQTKVRVRPLDAIVSQEGLPPPDLVKMDVQGFEAKVMAGGSATLRQAKRIVVEASLCLMYQRQPLMPEILSVLSQWGFELTDISEACRTWPDDRLWQVDLWLRRPQ